MKVLLTGGAGYVGSACLRWLLKQGHDAVTLDDLSLGNRWAVPPQRLVEASVHDGAAMRRALRDHNADAVMHFAALAVVPESVSDPESYWRQNVAGTKSVLDAMRDCGVDKIIFSSTCAVYGANPPTPITEDLPRLACTPYGNTKVAAEQMIEDYSAAYGIGYANLRYFNACGADGDGRFGESRRRETHLIPLILYAALGRRDTLQIFGDDWPTRDGTCVRDYVHTDDLALAHQLALEQLEPGDGRFYNVGIGHGVTVKEVFAACEEVVGRPIPHKNAPRRPGDPAELYADSEKIRRELGWSPRYTDIRDIVATAWAWHQNEPPRES